MNTVDTTITPISTTIARPVFSALSSEDIRRTAPSVFAEHAKPGLSPRYTFVSTAQLISLLESERWEPVRVSEQRVRAENRIGFQMHEIRLARRADIENRTLGIGDVRPEMIVQNAHDGSRAYRIDAGLYRLVCRNGLTVADSTFAHVSVRHVDVSEDAFVKAAQSVTENTPRVLETVTTWQRVQLSHAARLEFAWRACALRWKKDETPFLRLTPQSLLAPLRYGDSATDLWTTFNVVQEHLLRGGDRYIEFCSGNVSRRNTTRPVGSLKNGQRLNKALWTLADEFAQH